MNLTIIMTIYGFVTGGTSVALGYEPRWRWRWWLWAIFAMEITFLLAWRAWTFFHPYWWQEVTWPSA